ncbi:hypothetical protein LOC54_07120 [Acetobacter sp. AN02]|uniref:hypothetical protein n=1 Tax=Acetobacter sp. AN02 TaxID=2894186 RepID=UPI0024346377|nr:hypothetical protein [Acetobacter sp. AN02]MDG6094882.1 hypothetical protein [Acetobacter sp. AN02]
MQDLYEKAKEMPEDLRKLRPPGREPSLLPFGLLAALLVAAWVALKIFLPVQHPVPLSDIIHTTPAPSQETPAETAPNTKDQTENR